MVLKEKAGITQMPPDVRVCDPTTAELEKQGREKKNAHNREREGPRGYREDPP
jgi:hypothetical protein